LLSDNHWGQESQYHVFTKLYDIAIQLQELNSRFREKAINLLTLSCALSPENKYKAFDVDTIWTLVEKYYPKDFSDQEKINLPFPILCSPTIKFK